MRVQRIELASEQVKEALTKYLNEVVFKEPIHIRSWEALTRGSFGECEEVRITLTEPTQEPV